MRVFVVLLMIAAASSQTPPAANPKKEHVERRALILRQMADLRAKLSALELELQLLEEARSAEPAPAAPVPVTSWREEHATPEGATKKPIVRCLSVTRDGKRCTRAAEAGAKFCWQHRHR